MRKNSAMVLSEKIIVFGVLNSQKDYSDAILKANKINSTRGPFSALILFVTSVDFCSNFVTPDIQTYILVDRTNVFNKHSKALEEKTTLLIHENVTILDTNFGVLKTKQGINLAWFQGADNDVSINEAIESFKKFAPIDIFLSKYYPKDIFKGVRDIDEDGKKFFYCHDTEMVTKAITPRYHFVSHIKDRNNLGKILKNISTFCERPPYYSSPSFFSNYQESDLTKKDSFIICRFVSLAPFSLLSNLQKSLSRFHYSFVLRLPYTNDLCSKESIIDKNSDLFITQSPFINGKRNSPDDDLNFSNKRMRVFKDVNKRIDVQPQDCFLCLANPDVTTHLIVSISENTYLTLARGPLLTPGGRHVLIAPLFHVAKLENIKGNLNTNEEILKCNVLNEQKKYVSSLLNTYFSETVLSSQLVVAFEFSREKNIHIHMQVVALPNGDTNTLKNLFIKSAKNLNYPDFQILNENNNKDFHESDYLSVKIYSKSNFNQKNTDPAVDMILEITKKFSNFDLQFPRKILAEYITSLEDQNIDISNWKKCVQSQKKEKQDSDAFKILFSEKEIKN